jgi:hypothetical protein
MGIASDYDDRDAEFRLIYVVWLTKNLLLSLIF